MVQKKKLILLIVSLKQIITSTPFKEENLEDDIYKFVFKRNETVHGDTGLYGCPGNILQVTSHPNFQTSESLVFVYVQCKWKF